MKIIIYFINNLKLFKAGELLDTIAPLKDFSKNKFLVAFLELKWTQPRRLLQLAKWEVWRLSGLSMKIERRDR